MSSEAAGPSNNITNDAPAKEVNGSGNTLTAGVSQKVALLKALLAVGAIEEALTVLCCHPYLLGPYPDLADLLLKTIHIAIEPLYSQINAVNIPGHGACQPRKRPIDTKYRDSELVLPPEPRVILSLNPLCKYNTLQTEEQFFYSDVSSKIRQCHTFGDFHETIVPLLHLCGIFIYRDVRAIAKLSRLGKAELTGVRTLMMGSPF